MPTPTDKHRRYWARNLRLTGWLLALWALLTFGVIGYGAPALTFDFFGWPFGYWAAAQGALVVYVVIVAVYARTMNRLDRAHEDDTD